MKKKMAVALLAVALALMSVNPSAYAMALQTDLAAEQGANEKLTEASESSPVEETPAGQTAEKTEGEPTAPEESAKESTEAEEKAEGMPEDKPAGGEAEKGSPEAPAESTGEMTDETANTTEEPEGGSAGEAQALPDENGEAVAEKEQSLMDMDLNAPNGGSGDLEGDALPFYGDTTKQTLRVTGTADYQKAFEFLEILNTKREDEGVGRVEMDRELLEAAMERAAECALKYGSERPNGNAGIPISNKVKGEDIAIGYDSAQKVMNAWMVHQGGEKGNKLMERASWRSVGIGCFYNNGKYSWAQCFGEVSAQTGDLPSNETRTYAIKAVSDKVKLKLSETKKSMKAGETAQIEVEATPGNGNYLTMVDAESYYWVSSNASVATVSSDGLITAQGAGKARITGRNITDDKATLTCEVTVGGGGESGGLDDVPAIGFWVTPVEPQNFTGKAIKPRVEVYYNGVLLEGKNYKISYRNNIDASESSAAVIATGKGRIKGGFARSFVILPKDISAEDVTVAGLSARFDGNVRQPAPALSYGGKALKKGRDYTVASGDCCAPGSYDFSIQGTGNYTGSRALTYTITGDRPVSKMTVAKIPAQTYQGSEISLNPVVKDGKRVLSKGVDYDISYQDNVKAGTARLILTGIPSGGYTGEKKVSFKIKPRSVKSSEVSIELEASYSLTPGGCKPEPVITFQGERLVKGVNYTLSYRNNKKPNAGTNRKSAPTVVIKGKGNFGGSCERTFAITVGGFMQN